MSWKIKEEYIDLAQSRHVVIFHNSDTKLEHHLVHHLSLGCCPACGDVKSSNEPMDFARWKADTLAALNDHHRRVMKYKELHAGVELRSKPKQ